MWFACSRRACGRSSGSDPTIGRSEVRVTVSADVPLATPVIGNIVGSSVGVEGATTMLVTHMPPSS
jgi:hypothetical protein